MVKKHPLAVRNPFQSHPPRWLKDLELERSTAKHRKKR